MRRYVGDNKQARPDHGVGAMEMNLDLFALDSLTLDTLNEEAWDSLRGSMMSDICDAKRSLRTAAWVGPGEYYPPRVIDTHLNLRFLS